MMKWFAFLLFTVSAWGQQGSLSPMPDCSLGTCSGLVVPTFTCKSGWKYANLNTPGTNYTCTGIPPAWVVDAGSGGGGGATLPAVQQIIGGKGDGNGVALPEKGITVSGTTGTVAWADDLNAGVYDPRDPRWGTQDTPAHQAAAFQTMENQIACDLSMGVVSHAVAKFPQGTFYADKLLVAPGSSLEGIPTSFGGTRIRSLYNNHQLIQAPNTMTVTCSDSNPHTDSLTQSHVSHLTLLGCAVGGCSNFAGDTGSYAVGGPNNTGLEMSSTSGISEYISTTNFGGYGIRTDGADTKTFHVTAQSDDEWYYYGGYKGAGESVASPETSTTTTGSTGKVTLNWTAVSGATGYIVYRGSTAGGESAWYSTGTNSLVDTGAANVAGSVTNVVTTAVAAPGAITPTPATSGGTLAAGTYFYKVTALGVDTTSLGLDWHGSIELPGADNMADWIEAYGLFDAPTAQTYHHLADILGGGGNSHLDHLWSQLGLVGIAQPFGYGLANQYENIRADFARLEGVYINDITVSVDHGNIDGSCTTANATTFSPTGTCNQLVASNDGDNISNIVFTDNNGFGPTYKTADYWIQGLSQGHNLRGTVQTVASLGTLAGTFWEPKSGDATAVTGAQPSVDGLAVIKPSDSSAVTITGFLKVNQSQDFYVQGGNGNVTIAPSTSPPYITTCSGSSINLGSVTGFLHFRARSYSTAGLFGLPGQVEEVCNSQVSPISLTTTGSSGPATLSAGVLNVPQYTGGTGLGYSSPTLNKIPAVSNVTAPGTVIDSSFSDDGFNTYDSEPFQLFGTHYLEPTNTASGSANYPSNAIQMLVSYWNGSAAVNTNWQIYSSVGTGTTPATTLNFFSPPEAPTDSFLIAINPTQAATSGANLNSPNFKLGGAGWTGSASSPILWTLQEVNGTGANPTTTLTASATGTSGVAGFSAPTLTATGGTPGIANNGAQWTGGTSLPGTCAIGDFFSLTNATSASTALQVCYPANTWNTVGGGSTSMGSTPTFVNDAGAGTSPTSSIQSGSTDGAGWMNVTTGTSPSASAGVITINYGGTYGTTPRCVVEGSNAAAAALSGTGKLYVPSGTSTTAHFVMNVGSSALAASTVYQFAWSCSL